MRSLLHQLDVGVIRASCLKSDKKVFNGRERGNDSTEDERRRLWPPDHGQRWASETLEQ